MIVWVMHTAPLAGVQKGAIYLAVATRKTLLKTMIELHGRRKERVAEGHRTTLVAVIQEEAVR